MGIIDKYSRNLIVSSPRYEKEKQYWLEKLANIEDVNSNWIYYGQQKYSKGIYDTTKVYIKGNTFDRIVQLGKKSDYAIYVILLSAIKYLFFKYTGCYDLISGMPAFINSHHEQYANEILPLIVNIRQDMAYKELLAEIKNTVMDADAHKGFPVLSILEQMQISNETTYKDFYKTIVLLKNIHDSDCLSDFNYNICFCFDMGKDSIILNLCYDTNLFNKEIISQISRHFMCFLSTVLNKPDIILDQIDVLSQDEYEQILNQFNNTYRESDKEKTIHQQFEEQANQTPGMTAVVYQSKNITYSELNKKANRLAHKLRQKGIKPDNIVGLMIERTSEMLVGMLGILKAGGAYLPIDPAYPEDRISYMLEDSGAAIMITHRGLESKVNFGGEVINLDHPESYAEEDCNPDIVNKPDNLAYVIYTSGSTGNPKGVMLEHRSVVNFFKGMTDRIDFVCGRTILALTTLSFDIFVLETLLPLTRGLKIVIADENQQTNPRELNRLLTQEKVDMLQATPSRMQIMMTDLKGVSSLKGLKVVMIGGESFPAPLLEKLKTLTNARIFNMYGPTETTVWSTVKELTDSDEINIGTPIANTQVYILDKNNRPVPIGVPGELYIGGDGLARGYYKREELTKERFVENLFRSGERIYKTGDIARWTHDGEIVFIGRADYQVKIRGYRIEPGEIESVLLKHEAIKEVAVIVRDSIDGTKILYAYYSSECELKVGELRSYMQKSLPEYMIPSYFIHLHEIPLTPNGKVDRKALPEVTEYILSNTGDALPENETEEKLMEIWKDMLDLDRLGVNDNFFHIGGNSLKAVELISKVSQQFVLEIPIGEMFNNPTIRGLAARITELGGLEFKQIPKTENMGSYPVNSAQKRLLILDKIEGPSCVYNLSNILVVEGEIDRLKLKKAIESLAERHEILRTQFIFSNDSIAQLVNKTLEVELEYFESDEAGIISVVDDFIKPFDLGKIPLFRTALIKVGDGKYVLIFDTHHIIADGISMNVIAREIFDLYEGKNLPELNIQFKDYVVWYNEQQASNKIEEQKKYWLDLLDGEIPQLNLPTDYPRPLKQNFEGDDVFLKLDESITDRIKKLAIEKGVTTYSFLLAAYNALLYKYTGQEDIIVATSVAGRTHNDLKALIGMFVNTVVMRNNPKGKMQFDELLTSANENTLKAIENQDYQFEELIGNLKLNRDASRNPLFDTMLTMYSFEKNIVVNENFKCIPISYKKKVSKFDLTLWVAEKEKEIEICFEYCSALFKRATIENLSLHFKKLIEEVLNNNRLLLDDIDILRKDESERILNQFNNTYREYDKKKTIHWQFEEQVNQTPDMTAIVWQSESITYSELNKRANRLANKLRQKGIKPDEIVGLMVERTPEMLVGILGILKAGGAYLPIDPAYPVDRIIYMLEDSEAALLLSHKSLEDKINFGGEVINLDQPGSYAEEDNNPDIINKSNNLAYVIYTSGSTGNPKGVILEHRSVVNLIKGMTDRIDFACGKTILALTTLSFDIFVMETLLPLTRGLKIVLADEKQQLDPKELKRLILEEKVDILQATPSRMQLIMTDINVASYLNSLKEILIGGEAFPMPLLERLKTHTKARIYNGYGPTEATVYTTVKELTDSDRINIGTPIANIQIYILDKNKKPVPIGLPGELYIGGDGLARGYHKREELTKERFVENLFRPGERIYKTGDIARWTHEGEIEFMGRADHQVKIRGYRIELGEIESVLLKHKAVKEAVILLKESEDTGKYLCGYYSSDKELSIEELRLHLLRYLPEYMTPAYYVRMDNIPHTPSGKIDRNALPDPIEYSICNKREIAEPLDNTERIIYKIWCDVLNTDSISIHDNFFSIGGNSLILIMMHDKLDCIFPSKLSVLDLFKYPTIHRLSDYLKIDCGDYIPKQESKEIDLENEFLELFSQLEEGNISVKEMAKKISDTEI